MPISVDTKLGPYEILALMGTRCMADLFGYTNLFLAHQP